MNFTKHTRHADIMLAVVLGLMLLALSRIRWDGWALPELPVWAWAFLAGFALRQRRSVRLGRWIQAGAHSTKGVFAGHSDIIRGIKRH